MALSDVKVYQLQALIDSGDIEAGTTVSELLSYLVEGKDHTCPQCAGSGTIDIDFDGEKDTECPTCLGDGVTEIPYALDRQNSTIVYSPITPEIFTDEFTHEFL